MAPSRRRPSGFTQAFTLIELLVVIAIIAILTAILLPVFNSVREGSRQSVSISNMKDIQQKMEQYKLDNHKYPDVLFGYAYPNSKFTTGLTMAQTYDAANPGSHLTAIYFPGLYPAYIKDPNVFTDPNNQTDPNSPVQVTPALTDAYVIAPCSALNDNILRGDGNSGCMGANSGQAVATQRFFYTLDAYDSNPVVTGGNTISSTAYLIRYQTARELLQSPVPSATSDPYYHQLRWQNPPADTLVTLTPYHVKNADKVLVIFESGAVKKIKAEDFLNPNADTAANFWTIKP